MARHISAVVFLSVLVVSSGRQLKQADDELQAELADAAMAVSHSSAEVFPRPVMAWAARNDLYLYAWCGLVPGNPRNTTDFIATIDATPNSTTFGQVIHVADTPYKGTQPHHCGVDRTGKWLGAGGLVSMLQPGTPDIMIFNTTNPAAPVYSHGITGRRSACVDEFLTLPARQPNGWIVTNMCARSGNPGGSVAILRGNKMNVFQESDGGLSKEDKAKSFTPHGVDIDLDNDRMVTCDFINIASTVIPAAGTATPELQTTIRIWKYSTRQILATIDLGRDRANGLMDVRKAPGPGSLFWVTNGYGQWILVDALALKAADEPAYCLNQDCSHVIGNCINSNTFLNNTRMLISSYALDQVRLLDISNPTKLVELDRYQMPKGAGGHVIKYHHQTRIAAVSSYFVDQAGTVVRFKSDNKVTLLHVYSTGDIVFNRIRRVAAIDFDVALRRQKGPSNCHGLAFNAAPVSR